MLSVQISSFSYSDIEILSNISFELKKGKHLAILGESGCGKSTLLHLIYGLLDLNEGKLSWGQQPLLGPKYNLIPGEEFIKLVAQEFDLMPFTTVRENIATHLPRIDAELEGRRVDTLLKVVELAAFANTKVKNLSGGQKQRVALAKALANQPKLILLDEPFSHIDTFRKNNLRRNVYQYLRENNISCITATHDAEEALAFSDQLLILKNGTIEAIGETEQVYKNLSSVYQAGFFGEVSEVSPHLLGRPRHSSKIVLLPHQLKISEEKTPLMVQIDDCFYKGTHYLVKAKYENQILFFNHIQKLKTGDLKYLKNKS